MATRFLHEELDTVSRFGGLKKETPDCIKQNLNPRFELRPYQEEAFWRFYIALTKTSQKKASRCSYFLTWQLEVAKH